MYMSNTLFANPNDQIDNYKKTLDDLISTKKELVLTSNDLNAKIKEYDNLLKKTYTIQPLVDKLTKENDNLKRELFQKIQENEFLQKENKNFNEEIEKMKEEYENNFNSIKDKIETTYKNRIKDEIENNCNLLLKEKKLELFQLQEKMSISEKENKRQMDLFEKEKKNEIDDLIRKHDIEKDILNQKILEMSEKFKKNEINNNNKNIDNINIIISELKIENNNYKNEISKLNNILNQYRTQNNNLLIESKQINKEKDDEIESLKFKANLQNNQMIDISTKLAMKEKQLIDVQTQLDILTNTYKNLERNHEYLLREKNSLTKEYNDTCAQVILLKNLINKREQEIENEIAKVKYENDPDVINNQLQQLRQYVDIRNQECDVLNNKYNLIKEEKALLLNKLKDLEIELEKNKILNYSEKNFKSGDFSQKNKEMKSVYDYLDKIKKENKINLKKKKHYKDQCKLYNQLIDVIMKKITKEQRKEIEKDIAFQKLISINNKNKKEYNNSLRENNIFDNTNSMSRGLINTNNSISMNKGNLNNIISNSPKKENNNQINLNNINNVDENKNNNIFNNNTYNNNIIENNNNNNVFNNKFNNNVINNNVFDNNNNNNFGINNINNNKDKGKNNDEEIPEDISYSESVAK